MGSQSERKAWVDILRGIGIVFVISGHLIALGTTASSYIFSFHMPLFFFISGYVYKRDKYKRLIDLLRRKAQALLIPYLLVSTIGFIFTYTFQKYKAVNLLAVAKEVLVRAQPEMINVGQIWFLVCLFVVEIIYYLISKGRTNRLIMLLLICTGFAGQLIPYFYTKGLPMLPWKIDVALTAVVFYGIGNLFAGLGDKTSGKYKYYLPIILVGSLLTSVVFGPYLNGFVNIVSLSFNHVFYYYLSAFAGIIFYITLARWARTDKYMEYLGKNSIIIFSTHSMVMLVVLHLVNSVIGTDYRIMTLGLSQGLFFTILTILVELPIVYIFRTYFPFVFNTAPVEK